MTSNGHGSTATIARILRLLAEHQENARALQKTLDLLTGAATDAKVKRHATVLDAALAIDAARQPAKKLGRPPNPKPAEHRKIPRAAERRAMRATSARLLAHFSDTPQPLAAVDKDQRLFSALIRWGYLKKKGDGYVRSAKAFEP